MRNDLISRQATVDAFNTDVDELIVAGKGNAETVEKYLNGVIDMIKKLPSIEPEIIRCKDCKHYEEDIMANPWGVCCHRGWVGGHIGHEVSEDGWCYRAERGKE